MNQGNMNKPERSKNLTQDVAEEIINLINERKYTSGDKIPNELELAEQLGVARSTIREAIKMLVSRNILEIKRGKGTYLAESPGLVKDPWGLDLIQDKFSVAEQLWELRMTIELLLTELAVQRATDQEIAEIQRNCSATEAAIRAHIPHQDYDLAFHLSIAEAAHNSIAAKVLKQIFAQSINIFVELSQNSLLNETIETHAMITTGIASRDVNLATLGMRKHFEYNMQCLQNLKAAHSLNPDDLMSPGK